MKSPPSILLLTLLPLSCWAFTTPCSPSSSRRLQPPSCTSSTTLSAKKKNKKNRSSSSGEGFGKSTAPAVREVETESIPASSSGALQSVDDSAPLPTTLRQQPSVEDLNLDPNLSPEERSQAILRSKFGLKSFEEQQADAGDYRALLDAEKKKERRDKLRGLDQLWPEDADFLAVLPPSLIKGIDTFLKLGLGACTVAFVAAGGFITVEAGAKATGKELPLGLESFVVDVVQPNFTPGLGVLLAFSISLGLFSIGLGGSAQSSYREKP